MDARTSTRIALALLVLFTSSRALGAVGKTDGSADVSQTGEANYSIPYWNLFPTDAGLNRLMGQANNYTLSNAAILRGALARFVQNGKLGAAAGLAAGAGTTVGGAIAASGCN